jgi:hypothetical protein
MTLTARKRQLKSSAAAAPLIRHRPVPSVAARTPVRHMTLPCHEIARTDMREGETINALVKRTKWAARNSDRKWAFRLPTICVLNGRPVLQKEWRQRLRAGDVVEFWSKPLGDSFGSGDSKNILALVAVIALAAFAPWAGGLVAGALGLGAIGASIATGIITIGGSLLINALVAPKPAAQGDKVDQLYSVAASGNVARLLQPRPVQYGRVKSFPDFAITPWSEFSGNDQFLNVLLSVTEGLAEYHNLYIDDTILWDSVEGVSDTFTDVEVAFYDPGEQVALFPTNVTQADEVSGQEIEKDIYIGGFAANAAGSEAKALAVDLVFPAGCFVVDGDGELQSASATLLIEYREIDDAGAPTGAGTWGILHNATYTYKTRNPVRLTIKEAVTPSRYEVRVTRTDNTIEDGSGSDTVVWGGLRAFIDAPNTFPVSTVAIRIKANAQLNERTARKFGVLCTRILPVWDGDEFVDTATRSPLWAFYDAATNDDYGAGRPPSKIDFQGVYDQATAAASRGDTFDFRFTSVTPMPEAFDTILKATRCRHRWSGDQLTIVRDEWSDTPRMLLTDREIVRGSLSIDYALNTDDSADAVIVEYFDEDIWKPAEVQYPPNGESFTATQPTRVRLDGVVNREHAYREAAFYYLQSQYRRVNLSLDTEHDGRMLGFGSRVRVQTELPQTWGYGGAVIAVDDNALTLSPAPTWTPIVAHYIAIRTKTGRQFGPVLCTQGDTAAEAVLDETDLLAVETAQGMTLADALERADGADDPSFDFGVSDARARSCLVVSGRPNGDRVSLRLVVDKEDVHETDLGTVPVIPSLPALRDPVAPVIAGLYANFTQGVIEPMLQASWEPAAGAQYYRAQVSYDSGVSWTQIYEGNTANFAAVADRAALRLRVQGIGDRVGAWSQIDIEAPTIEIAIPPGSIGDSALTDDLNALFDQLRTTAQASIAAALDDIRGQIEALAAANGGAYAVRDQIHNAAMTAVGQVAGDARAQVVELQQAIVDDRTSLAQALTSLLAVNESGYATGLIQFSAIAAPAGVGARFAVELRATTADAFAEAGMYLDVGVVALGGGSRFLVKADQFAIEDSGGTDLLFDDGVLSDPDGVMEINLSGGYILFTEPA